MAGTEQDPRYASYADTSRYPIDIPTLLNHVVAKIPARWEDVGLLLGIPQDILDGIKVDISHGGSPNNFFKAVILKHWSTHSYAPFNWCTILNVLSQPYIGRGDIAEEIAEYLDRVPRPVSAHYVPPVVGTVPPTGVIEQERVPTEELTAIKATNLLRESGFRTFSNWSKLACTLEVSLEDRKRLRQKGRLTDDYNEILEESLSIWINGGNASWDKLIKAVEIEEKNTARTLKTKLNLL